MPFCILYIIVTYRNGRGFAETGKKVKKKNLHEREENGGQHVARSGRQALGREKTGKTDCCGQRHHGASLTRSPGRQYLRLNHCCSLALCRCADYIVKSESRPTSQRAGFTMRHSIVGFAFLLTILGPLPALSAQDAGIEFFEKTIRPILVEHCHECHAVGANKIRGHLLLASRAGVRTGGVSGPVIEPGDPDKSLLIKAVRYTDPELKMPKKGKLPAALIADLETWVKMGAP